MPIRVNLGSPDRGLDPARTIEPSSGAPKTPHPICRGTALLALLLVVSSGCRGPAAPSNPEPPERPVLRIGTSADYAPFSIASGVDAEDRGEPGWADTLTGFDIEVARAYARDRGREIHWVHFRWPALLEDLAADRFDLAMSGITVRPERSLAGAFTLPVARSGAVLLLEGPPPRDPLALDHPGTTLAVNAGGHLERVTRRQFPRAHIRAIPDNGRVLSQLDDPAVAAVVTDSLEAPHWMKARAGLRLVGPFTRDRKAYLVRSDQPELAADLDQWLAAREADGTLQRLRASKLGPGGPGRSADPMPALLAAIDERLALMRWVAEDKRRRGLAIEDRERERRVIEAGVASATARAPLSPELEDAIEHFFRLQIEAAKDIQRAVSARAEEPPPTGPNLEAELRPALIRIGARIGRLLVALPGSREPLTRHAPRIANSEISQERRAQLAEVIEAIRRCGPGGGQCRVPGS